MAGLLQPLHPPAALKGLRCKTFLAHLGVALIPSSVTAHRALFSLPWSNKSVPPWHISLGSLSILSPATSRASSS